MDAMSADGLIQHGDTAAEHMSMPYTLIASLNFPFL